MLAPANTAITKVREHFSFIIETQNPDIDVTRIEASYLEVVGENTNEHSKSADIVRQASYLLLSIRGSGGGAMLCWC